MAYFARLAMVFLIHAAASAQPAVTVDFTGASIASLQGSPPDLVRTSTGTISPAAGYLFSFNPVVRGTGFLGGIIVPSPTPLGDVLNSFLPGSQRVLHGAMRNPPATIPVQLDREVLSGTFSGLSISLTFDQRVLADGRGQAGVLNIQKPVGLGLSFISGGATYATFSPPAALRSEWHFGNDLRSVRETGLAPASGPGRLRYLDDPAFGPILGGPGELTQYPSPPTPQDVTRNQSAFGSTADLSLPPIGGSPDSVFRTSPPRNAGDPSNRAKSRGIGLALYASTRDGWPDDRLGQWTFVWDILIPGSSWNAGEFVVPLIEDNHNNDGEADLFIRNVGGVAHFGYQVPRASDLAVPGIHPGVWFRLALVSDGYRLKQGRLFVNGQFVGLTGGDWVYAATRSADPRFGDVSTGNPLGTPVPPAQWLAWGAFPSPWAQAPNATLAPMASTICLFSDLQGRGEGVYLANLFFTDEALSDGAIGAFGGPNARGIAYLEPLPPCPPDFNADGTVDFFDYDDFVACFEGFACPPGGVDADFNDDGSTDFFDYDDFVAAFEVGC